MSNEEEFIEATVNINAEKPLKLIEDLIKNSSNIEILNLVEQEKERVKEKFSTNQASKFVNLTLSSHNLSAIDSS